MQPNSTTVLVTPGSVGTVHTQHAGSRPPAMSDDFRAPASSASATAAAAAEYPSSSPASASFPHSAGGSSSSKSAGKRVAPVPRFQRRQSERQFLETSYRESTPTMDYPSGNSPWASSPDASRTSFGGDVPREDLPGPAVQSHDANGSDAAYTHQPTEHHDAGWGQEQQQNQWHQQQPQSEQQSQQQQQAHQGSSEENRRPTSQSRYHNVLQQQRQHVPQYKLQAKITGLERTGKKDPILRFDVYVRVILRLL